MSLAIDFLRGYFSRPDAPSQADFAKASGMTGANVTDLLNAQVGISGRNVSKLLRGLGNDPDRLAFLAAYLRDEVPSDFADAIHIGVRTSGLEEPPEGEQSLQDDLLQAFAALPSDMHRRRTVKFLQHLRRDHGLRDLFARTCVYLEEADADARARTNSSDPAGVITSQSYADLKRRDAERGASPGPSRGGGKAPPTPRGKKRARGQ